jgi:hypothetical protein
MPLARPWRPGDHAAIHHHQPVAVRDHRISDGDIPFAYKLTHNSDSGGRMVHRNAGPFQV